MVHRVWHVEPVPIGPALAAGHAPRLLPAAPMTSRGFSDDFLGEAAREVDESGLFDPDWYLREYEDVALAGMDPVRHYLWLGWRLSRDPGPKFDTGFYLRANPDVAASGAIPLLHYIRQGRREDRESRPSARAAANAPRAAHRGPEPVSPPADAPVAAGLAGLAPDEVRQVQEAFDTEHYLRSNPELGLTAAEAFAHYMSTGWREGRDPSPSFSTGYYLEHAPALRAGGLNPFVHYVLRGMREKRATLPFRKRLEAAAHAPTVTAIVPNYNHAAYLEQRIESVLNQTYPNLDLIVLDDCSTDDSRAVIERYCARYPDRVRAILNDANSGRVFKQWRRGVEAATGELVWICESDDFCEPDFLERLVPHFRDRSVQIAFGRIQFAEADGSVRPGLDAYREGAEPGIWDAPVTRPAREWFTRGFGVNNVIANVGGCVWRRQTVPDAVWSQAEGFTVLGDWFLYHNLAGGGQIAYEPKAVAYFRQHRKNTSVTSFQKEPYYAEHHRLMQAVTDRWPVPAETIDRFVGKVRFQYDHLKRAGHLPPFETLVRAGELKAPRRRQPHVLIAFLGFHPGGGEMFPIHLANALHAKGTLVSMVALDMTSVKAEMLALLDPGIPVYDAAWVVEEGVDRFLSAAGVSLIHSHMLSLEHFFFERCAMQADLPYLVSLHGSYEASEISEKTLRRIISRVTHYVYTADKNLQPFEALSLPPDRFSKIGNGMPRDPRPFPQSREELGIAGDAVVFTLVARGIKRKGWRASIDALHRLRARHPGRPVHLLLCGEGEEVDLHRARHGDDPDITFLGYQSRIDGLYELSDCALVPTRFAGESFPLCMIQAMLAGTPLISTRVGEIPTMVGEDETAAGLLIEAERDTERFTDRLAEAMEKMLDPERRRRLSDNARARGRGYDIGVCADAYLGLYEALLEGHADTARYLDAV